MPTADASGRPLPILPQGARVCVVGAGSVGVYAAKACAEVGWEPTVYEAAGSLGGVWRAGQHWGSLTTNSSWRMMELGDFPFPFTPSGPFPTRSEIVRYVEAYAKHFDVERRIRFHTRVLSVEPTAPDAPQTTQWRVTTGAAGAGEGAPPPRAEIYDAVMCCNGQYDTPALPRALTPPHSDGFTGEVLHSHAFGSGERCAGKHVVVVGLGNSALDVALECVGHGAASVTVACRNGAHLLPVSTPAGAPRDEQLLSRFFEYRAPTMYKQYCFFAPVKRVSDAFVKAGMPAAGAATPHPIHQRISNVKQWKRWLALLAGAAPPVRFQPSSIAAVGPGRRVLHSDGTTAEADVVVGCTGYQLHFPFLPDAVLDAATVEYALPPSKEGAGGRTVRSLCLYKRVLHPVYPTMAFCSQLATLGNEAAVGELQARWFAHLLTDASAPSRPTVEAVAAGAADLRTKLLTSKPLVPGFLSYVKYCDALAADIGALPPTASAALATGDLRLAWQLVAGPVVPAQYRLISSDATVAATARRLVSTPTTIPPSKL